MIATVILTVLVGSTSLLVEADKKVHTAIL